MWTWKNGDSKNLATFYVVLISPVGENAQKDYQYVRLRKRISVDK